MGTSLFVAQLCDPSSSRNHWVANYIPRPDRETSFPDKFRDCAQVGIGPTTFSGVFCLNVIYKGEQDVTGVHWQVPTYPRYSNLLGRSGSGAASCFQNSAVHADNHGPLPLVCNSAIILRYNHIASLFWSMVSC